MKKDIFGDEEATDNSQDFARLFEASMGGAQKASYKTGDKVRAEVLMIGRDDVSVSLSASQDGFIPKKEVKDADGNLTVKVGDMIDAYVVQYANGVLLLSTKVSNKALAESLEDAFDFGTAVEGRVSEVVNGGFRVKIFGKLAFCPLSQIDDKPVQDANSFIDKKLDFIIEKYEEGGRNIVVSHRKFLKQQKEEGLGTFLNQFHEGDVVQGTVTKFEQFGAFVELVPGIEGLIHISEVSWSHLKHPEEALHIGQKVNVKILKIEDHGQRLKISLSKKQMDQDPWVAAEKLFREGQIVQGKVTKCLPFGAFVEVESGIEGLIPLSEMSYEKRVVKSDDLVQPGDTVSVMVKQVNVKDQRMTLSLRDGDGATSDQIKAAQGPAAKGGLGTMADLFKNLKK